MYYWGLFHVMSKFMSGFRLAITALVLLASMPLFAQRDNNQVPLFKLKRSKNESEVHYLLNQTERGEIDVRDPLQIVWSNKSSNAKHEPISWAQKRWGYGVKIVSQGPDHLDFYIVSRPDRLIRIMKMKGRFQASTEIMGEPACLKELYVAMKPVDNWIPEVLYVDLIGVALEGGEPIIERLNP